MDPVLTRLEVPPSVQEFFSGSYTADGQGNLLFHYGDAREHFSLSFHRVPRSCGCWTGGNKIFGLVSEVFICSSAMEAIAYLSLNHCWHSPADNLLFVSVGTLPSGEQLAQIRRNLKHTKCSLVFGNCLLGRAADLKVSACLRGAPIALQLSSGGRIVEVLYSGKRYSFKPDELSLKAFENAAGFRSGLRTRKARNYNTYLDLLRSAI